MKNGSRKTYLLILVLSVTGCLKAQTNNPVKIFRHDTIQLREISIPKAVALHFDNTIVLVNKKPFMKHLAARRKDLRKDVTLMQRQMKKHPNDIIRNRLNLDNQQLSAIDSVVAIVQQSKADTVNVDYLAFAQVRSAFLVDFLAPAIDEKKCVVLNLNYQQQREIIIQRGRRELGKQGASGTSYYFIPGSSKPFLSKTDWFTLNPGYL